MHPRAKPGPDSLTEATLATVQRFNEAFNRRDVDAVMALMIAGRQL